MKTILMVGATQVERVSDDMAFRLVTDGKAVYKPKWMFKRKVKELHPLPATIPAELTAAAYLKPLEKPDGK